MVTANEYEVSQTQHEAGPSTDLNENPDSATQKLVDAFWWFLYNPQTKKIMGRTLINWGKLGLFYLVFYCVLFGSFTAFIQLFFLTLNNDRPTYNYYDDGNKHPMLADPGMGMRPLLMSNKKVPEIEFDMNNVNTYGHYVSSIQNYIGRDYNTLTQNVTQCDGSTSSACMLDQAQFNMCNGSDITYGYSSGEPCVLLKLNKIIGWKPNPVNAGETNVQITCVQDNTDKCPTCLGTPDIYPSTGLSHSCFPYCGKESSAGYMSPIVMVKFRGIERGGKRVTVYCKADSGGFAHNKYTRNDKLMSTRFTFIIHS